MNHIANNDRRALTLIELLVVIAVVAVLAVVVLLVLNPAELLRQTRDAIRLSDLNILNRALDLYKADMPNNSMGQAKTVYVSLPDAQATTTQGTDCASIRLPALPTNWSYHCATSSTLRNVDGTGWIPVNLQRASFDSPLSVLPVDPVNTVAGGLYYTYGAGSWDLTAAMESVRYGSGGSNNVVSNDGGQFGDLFEIGTDASLLPVDRVAAATDATAPTVTLTAPSPGATVSSTVLVSANASDDVAVAGVQFAVDGSDVGAEVTVPPYQINWDTTAVANGPYSLTAVAWDTATNATTSLPVAVTVSNPVPSPLSLVQFTVASNAPGNVCSLSLNSPVIAGDLLVFTIGTNSSTAAVSVTGNQGNVWQTATAQSSNAGTQDIFYASNAAAGTTNAIATIANWSDADRSCALAEYSGVSTLDVVQSANGTGVALSSGTSTTNFAAELIVGGGSFPSCASCTFSAGSGFSTVAASTVSFQEYATTTSADSYSASALLSASSPWLMNMATFR